MFKLTMSSTDSSDDENSALLREAVDTQFINDGMFSQAGTSKNKTSRPLINCSGQDLPSDIKNQPSLRPTTDKDDQFNTLGVTPQFQEYVARQLSGILEQKLQKKLSSQEVASAPRKRKKGGIKLFSASKKFVKIPKNEPIIYRRNKNSVESDNSDNEAKCSEVAVTPENILNKKDVKNWSTRSKAPVFKYKKSANSTLSSLD